MINLLSKGLNFCPTPGEPDRYQLRKDLDKFHVSLRRKIFFDKRSDSTCLDHVSGPNNDVPSSLSEDILTKTLESLILTSQDGSFTNQHKSNFRLSHLYNFVCNYNLHVQLRIFDIKSCMVNNPTKQYSICSCDPLLLENVLLDTCYDDVPLSNSGMNTTCTNITIMTTKIFFLLAQILDQSSTFPVFS